MSGPRIYFYKMTADDGGAPHVHSYLLSLAICKPFIRMNACVGDLVVGFAATKLHRDNRLVYLAVVTCKLCAGDYYKKKQYERRGDCIYEAVGNEFFRKQDARYHDVPEHLRHDLGNAPWYVRA